PPKPMAPKRPATVLNLRLLITGLRRWNEEDRKSDGNPIVISSYCGILPFMKKVWIHRSQSFAEADRFDLDYYRTMGADKRLETMQYLRELGEKLKPGDPHGQGRKGLRRIIKVVQ
ncbi:MAG: hypothetical protein Q7S00_06655, partial [bacterium]|nr:hypothetical protein [bacterium]